MYEREAIVQQLEEKLHLNKDIIEDCHSFIKRVIESRHLRVMTRQKRKFELLYQQKTGGCLMEENFTSGEETSDTPTSKWVKNLSDKPLTQAQRRLLAHGPNYAIIPRNPPKEEYIAAIEQACHKLKEGEADELRVEVKNLLKKAKTPRSNISREEFQAINELKRDDSRIILTADKGVAMVVLDKEEYIKKAKHLLNQPTYKKIAEDPTSKQKARLIKLLKNIKAEGGITEDKYKKMYPTGAGAPKFYGLPKIHKQDTPLRPIVSSTGTVSYNTAKELASILKPLVGLSSHHLKNTKDFIQQLKEVKLQQDETIISYDIKALFISVPIQPVLDIIKNKLENDQQLQQRTSMTVSHITSLLEYCLRSTYFVFQGEYYEQLEGAAMGSPLSPTLLTYTWRSLRPKPSAQHPTPLPCGKGL